MSKTDSEKLDELLLAASRIEKALKIVPDRDSKISDFDSSVQQYRKFAKEDLGIQDLTIKNQMSTISAFLGYSHGVINKDTVKAYLDSNDSTAWKSNQLKALRRYIRDFLKLGRWIEEFHFELTGYKTKKNLPTDKELILFFNELPAQEQMIFLLLLNSGLRISEVLGLKLSDLNFQQNMIDASNVHKGKTKSSWYSFFTGQTSEWLSAYFNENGIYDPDDQIFSISVRAVQQVFKTISESLGLDLYPHLLRTIFTEKCRKAGLKDDYINAFCGRTAKTVLARHYTDYSPESLRAQYDKVEPFLILE